MLLGTGGGEGAVGDDFSEAYGLIVFGCGVLMPHSNDDLLGADEDLFGKGLGVAGAHLVIGQELLVDALRPSLGNLVIRGAGSGSWCSC